MKIRKINNHERRVKFKFFCLRIRDYAWNIDEIINQLKGIRGVCFGIKDSGISLLNDTLYRARPNEQKSLFQNVTELKYPPSSSVTNNGRCNRVGSSILYASTSELGTITEHVSKGFKLNTLFTIAVLKKNKKQKLIFKAIGVKSLSNSTLSKIDKYSKDFHKFCDEEFSKQVDPNNKNFYNFTIALSEFYLNDSIKTINPTTKKKIASNFDFAITYTSVHSGYITNKTVYNIAMRPEVFDKHYQIIGALTYVLVHNKDDNTILLIEVNKATVREDLALSWEYSYDEMAQRIASGKGYNKAESIYLKNNADDILT